MLEAVAAGALAALIGGASGQILVLSAGRRRLALRVAALEQSMPELISRSEVQNAFAQVAQIEAQRQSAAMQQARSAANFGVAPGSGAPADLNTGINAQLSALQERMSRINAEFGVR